MPRKKSDLVLNGNISQDNMSDEDKIIHAILNGGSLSPQLEKLYNRMREIQAFRIGGASKAQTARHFAKEWVLKEKMLYRIMQKTEQVLGSISQVDKQYMRAVQSERLEKLYQSALVDGDKAMALEVLKEINKLNELYGYTNDDKPKQKLPDTIIYVNNSNVLLNGKS